MIGALWVNSKINSWNYGVKARIFLLVDLQTLLSNYNFPECWKKIKLISEIIFLFYPPTLNIICFVEKIIYFEVLSVYFWEWHY